MPVLDINLEETNYVRLESFEKELFNLFKAYFLCNFTMFCSFFLSLLEFVSFELYSRFISSMKRFVLYFENK